MNECNIEYVDTEPFGLYKTHPSRREKVIRLTKTLVITEFGRYDRKTGKDIDIVNKTVGGYRLSPDSRKIVNGSG